MTIPRGVSPIHYMRYSIQDGFDHRLAANSVALHFKKKKMFGYTSFHGFEDEFVNSFIFSKNFIFKKVINNEQ